MQTHLWTGNRTSGAAHPDLDAVLSLELGDVLVPPGQLGAVERPEATHHLDAGLRRVRHVAMVGWVRVRVRSSRAQVLVRERFSGLEQLRSIGRGK